MSPTDRPVVSACVVRMYFGLPLLSSKTQIEASERAGAEMESGGL